MESRKWTNEDIEELKKSMTRERVVDIRDNIQAQVSTWLFGLDRSIGRRVEALFMLVPYTDPISGEKLLSQAHILFQSRTGVGKTDIEQAISLAIKAKTSRIQCDEELMPHDIIGSQKIVENLRGERRVVFNPGPLLSNLVVVDEASRMRTSTNSAFLQAGEERTVTPRTEYVDDADSIVHTLPVFPISGDYTDFDGPRFFQMGLTQNPHGDEEGNKPNSQALLDRITLAIDITPPGRKIQQKIRAKNVFHKKVKPVSDLAEILACAQYIFENVNFSEPAEEYLTLLLCNTNPPDPDSENPDACVTDPPELVDFVKENVQVGASPRVNFHLEAVARVRAFFSGSYIVKPEHVKEVASEVIAHRLRLAPEAEFSISKKKVFKRILELTKVPKWK